MHVVIRFIGLILLYQAEAGGPHHAIIPQWEKGDRECKFEIMEHRPFIRVSTKQGGVANDKQWPKFKDCDPGLDCAVYRIPDGSTLSIETGFAAASHARDPVPCLVPDFTSEEIAGPNPELHPDALTKRSAVDYVLPAGHLTANQFRNDQIYSELTLAAPSRSTASKITVVATPRKGVEGKKHVLVLKPGTTVDIVSAPPDHAVMDYNAELDDENTTEMTRKGHFFFLRKLLNVEKDKDCNLIADEAPDTCGNICRNRKGHCSGSGQTVNLGCGNGRRTPPPTSE
jgi:hypothetical protein